MQIHYAGDGTLPEAARELLDFDVASVLQLIAADRGARPDVWAASPADYEAGGRLLRDSESIRLIAYAPELQTVYATDGCNVCRHRLPESIEALTPEKLERLSAATQLPVPLLARLAAALADR